MYHLAFQALQHLEADVLDEIDFPMMILQGKEDTICRPEGAQRLYERAKSKDKSIQMYDNAKHNLFIELGDIPDRALADSLAWMDQRV